MAGAAVAGMGDLVSRYYSCESSTEQTLLRNVMEHGIEIAGEVREDLAVRIVEELARAMNPRSSSRRRD